MRKNKTGKKNRTTYIYYGADGKKVMELVPGNNGVTETDILMLHKEDDQAFDAQRREDYHAPVHYNAFISDSDDHNSFDRNLYLADYDSDPETIVLELLDNTEKKAMIRLLWNALLPQQRELVIKKLRGLSNTDIAAAEGVTEAAVRNRLKKIQERFKCFRKKES